MWSGLLPVALLVAQPAPAWQQKVVSLLRSPELKNASYSVVVADKNGKVLFDQNGERLLVPASNMKLISTAFALERLGPDFRPVTRFWRSGDTITIDSSGDPSMTSTKLGQIRDQLGGKSTLVRLRQSYRPGVHGTWEYDDLPNRYAAPVTAFTCDRGSFEVRTQDGRFVSLQPELQLEAISAPDSGPARAQYNYWNDRVRLLGTPKGTGLVEAFALRNPDFAAARYLGTSVVTTRQVPDTKPSVEWPGDPMRKLVADCLQPSDNLYAENLLLMAAQSKAPLGSAPWATATADVQEFLTPILAPIGVNFSIADGSGLSRQNLVTTRGLIALLHWTQTRPWGAVYRAGMARPGLGTLSDRLSGSSFAGKTGTLSGVVALSGFLKTKSGDDLTVSIIVNNSGQTSKTIRGLVDQIVVSIETLYAK